MNGRICSIVAITEEQIKKTAGKSIYIQEAA
jgi:hypothetical protein